MAKSFLKLDGGWKAASDLGKSLSSEDSCYGSSPSQDWKAAS